MFNEELKRRYIEDKRENTTVPEFYLEYQFNNVQGMEEELGKDAYDFTVYEIMEYYKLLNISTLESLAVLNSHFSLYTQWCLSQNIVKDNQNHYLELNLEQLQKCLNKVLFDKKIVDRKQVVAWCEQLPNPKDQVVMLGLFEGLKGKDFADFVNLRPCDVHGNTLTLFDGREIEVSKRLIRYIDHAISEDTYYSASEMQVKQMPLVDRGYVIKEYPNTKQGTTAFIKGRAIYNGIARSLKYVGVFQFMSANNISESGKISMIKERAKHYNMTPREYIYSEEIKEVEHQFNCHIAKSTFCLKYQDYLEI